MRLMRVTVPVGFFILAALLVTGCLDPDEPGNLVPKTVVEDLSLPCIEVNGTTLHCETFGDRQDPVIIFLHGGPGGDYRGMTKLSALADEYFCVFFDQRGTGLSERLDADEIDIDTYVEDLDQIISMFADTNQVILVGHSWGAQYATVYISAHPGRVSHAVLSDPGPFKGERFGDMPIFTIDLTAEWLNDLMWMNTHISPDDHARKDYAMLIGSHDASPNYHFSETDPAPKWRLGAVCQAAMIASGTNEEGEYDWDFTTGLDEFTDTVLFIRSGLNEVHTESYFQMQMADYPNARMETIENVGHDMEWVKADEYIQAVREYLGGE
ncbi:alpha/beta hydrolase [candidate division WOR-3 bacterium]|nr:alpha/beta hydrolase [candidate division WOR-3 bacterium]